MPVEPAGALANPGRAPPGSARSREGVRGHRGQVGDLEVGDGAVVVENDGPGRGLDRGDRRIGAGEGADSIEVLRHTRRGADPFAAIALRVGRRIGTERVSSAHRHLNR